MIILKVALCYIIPELIKHVLSSDFFTTWTVFISEAFSIWKHHKLSLAVTQHMFDVLTWWFSELSRRQILPSKVRNHLRHEANLYSSCRKSHEDEKKIPKNGHIDCHYLPMLYFQQYTPQIIPNKPYFVCHSDLVIRYGLDVHVVIKMGHWLNF